MYLKSCSVHTEERKAAEWENAAEMVKTYSDEMVARWNKEIDTYLVYVRTQTARRELCGSHRAYFTGWPLLRHTDGVQRSVVFATPTRRTRPLYRHSAANLLATRELLNKLTIRKLHPID